LAGIFVIAALVCNYFIVERPGEVKERMERWRDYLPKLGSYLRHDRAFGRVTAVRLLAGLHMLAAPFYVLYATQVAGLPEASVGLFVTAQTIGGAAAGLALGWVAARFGTRRVVQASATLDVIAILLALTLALTGIPDQFTWVFPIIFALLGMVEAALALGFFNYVLDIAPAAERPVYLGLTNTLVGVLVVVPLIGGWLLEHTSYTTLFAITLIGVAPGALLALSLPKPAATTPPEPLASAPDLQGPA
jgi:MFS family permease